MIAEHRCRTCGSVVPADAPRLSCPSCLLRAGLDDSLDDPEPFADSGSGDSANGWPLGPAGQSALLTLDRIAGAMPRLLLHDTWDEAEAPIARSASPEMPAHATDHGRYQLFGEIARGGMGAILKGRDTDLGRDLAVKVLLASHQGRPELVRRFVEEAQIGGQLQHPGIVPVYELGTFEDRRPYFTMKLVKGRTLAAVLADRGDALRNRTRLLGIFEQVCQTVAYAHARGVIHRDLKPSNVMVGSFGEVQVMDWGLAKVLHARRAAGTSADDDERESSLIRTGRGFGDPDESRAGEVMGTPSYMAPEQARGEVHRLDERVDVFALGAMLCEILTGEPPYSDASSVEAVRRAARADLDEAFHRLKHCGADTELIDLAKDCLAVEPWARPRQASAVAERVAAYRAGVERRVREAELERERAQARAEEERKRRRLQVGLAGTAAAALLLGVAGWITVDRAERAHRARWAQQVQTALEEANRLGGEAQGNGGSDPSAWDRAVAEAEKADSLFRAGGSDPDWRQRVDMTLARLSAQRDRAHAAARSRAADRKLVKALDTNRLDLTLTADGDWDYFRWIDANLAALRVYGLDIDRLAEEESARRVRSSAVRNEILAALDDMAMRAGDDLAARLLEIARLADPDPLRDRLRAALVGRDATTLRRLAHTPEIEARLPGASATHLADWLIRHGERAQAIDLLRTTAARHPADYWVHVELAQLLANLGESGREESTRHTMAALALKPSAGQLSVLGLRLGRAGHPDEALPFLRQARDLDPGLSAAWANEGLALLMLDRPDESIEASRKSLRIASRQFPARLNLAIALDSSGRTEEAIAAFRDALAIKPNHATAHRRLGECLARLRRLDEAVAEFTETARLDPADALARHYCGVALRELGRPRDSISHLQSAARVARNDAKASESIAQQLRKAERQAALEARLPEILKDKDDEPAVDPGERLNLAELLYSRRRYAPAARLYIEEFETEGGTPSPSPRLLGEAAACLALAASGRDDRDAPLDEALRVRYRGQATTWLRRAVSILARDLKAGKSGNRERARRTLGDWKAIPDLAALRDDAELAKLPDTERKALRAFWNDVDSLLVRLRLAPPSSA